MKNDAFLLQKNVQDLRNKLAVCEAFPEGIPIDLLHGFKKRHKPYKSDHGIH
ncbi:hypothetical protein [Methanococcoides alaskense]|uniref:Uncharacterized protein n=1 Tax=Methanococcoides alaskense TaxID=325778 RepID=A0AA90ZBI9_9EURY|nr:hypothetical protein [Methanococcoides alaskense]MDA0524898.1 hypothetical protein [Methanococcoides alaskense]MDR6222187.1 hypothetical protein [Methanococcoides alaskense]